MADTRNRMAAAHDEFPERLPGQLVQDFHAAFGENASYPQSFQERNS